MIRQALRGVISRRQTDKHLIELPADCGLEIAQRFAKAKARRKYDLTRKKPNQDCCGKPPTPAGVCQMADKTYAEIKALLTQEKFPQIGGESKEQWYARYLESKATGTGVKAKPGHPDQTRGVTGSTMTMPNPENRDQPDDGPHATPAIDYVPLKDKPVDTPNDGIDHTKDRHGAAPSATNPALDRLAPLQPVTQAGLDRTSPKKADDKPAAGFHPPRRDR